ncbi:hypothetical protein ACJZ2D_016853 [Fusarium nematophilum]
MSDEIARLKARIEYLKSENRELGKESFRLFPKLPPNCRPVYVPGKHPGDSDALRSLNAGAIDAPACDDASSQWTKTPYINRENNGIFFVLKTVKGRDTHVAQVKTEVTDVSSRQVCSVGGWMLTKRKTEWLQHLRRLPHCSNFVLDILRIVETEMLVVLEADRTRSSSEQLRKHFDAIQSMCRNNIDYCLQQVPEHKDAAAQPGKTLSKGERESPPRGCTTELHSFDHATAAEECSVPQ